MHPVASKTIGQLWDEFDRDAHSMVPVSIALPGDGPNHSLVARDVA